MQRRRDLVRAAASLRFNQDRGTAGSGRVKRSVRRPRGGGSADQ
jgi:hypothetical protein